MNSDTEERARLGGAARYKDVLMTVAGRAGGDSSEGPEETLTSERDWPQKSTLKEEKREAPKSLCRREMKQRVEKSQAPSNKCPGPAHPTHFVLLAEISLLSALSATRKGRFPFCQLILVIIRAACRSHFSSLEKSH